MDETNAAWVQAEIPLPPAQLLEFLAAAERVWRLNPYLAIDAWQPRPDGGFVMSAANESNGCRVEVSAARATLPQAGFRYTYDQGLKRETEFRVEARGAGSLLTVTERYAPLTDPADPRAREADKSLLPWIAAVRRHLTARARWGALPGWLWWHERFMPSMPPRQRRIVRLLVWTTAAEFAVFVVLVLAWQLA